MAQIQASSRGLAKPCGRQSAAFTPVRCSAGPVHRTSSAASSNAGSLVQLTRPARLSMAKPSLQTRQAADPAVDPAVLPAVAASVDAGKLISSTEVPSFIPRDDMMDQLYRWTLMEAGESGHRKFGMPMKIEPQYFEERLWGFNVAIFKEGVKQTDLGIMFDKEELLKHEWVGRGEDGFPVMEGKSNEVKGKMFEIWKMDSTPVDEDLRSTIRAYCTALVAALNRYYAFGSVFVDDNQ